ncbi:MAG: DMT family transporter [Thermodesulfobacteriota bacterium]|nr:DMT family transporter [Thermodesulfobacteriota bacterium]
MIIYIKLFLTAAFWGGTFIAGKVLAQNVGPFSASFLRFLTASCFLLIITWKMDGRLPGMHRKQIFPVILLGLTGVFSYNVFFFKGLRLIDAGRASIIIANNPIFITIFAALIFREKLTLPKFIGVLISVTGAVIVISKGNLNAILSSGLGLGELYIFCCVASWVCYSLIGKAVMNALSPLVSVTYSAIIGTACLFVPALFEGMLSDMRHYMVSEWVSIFYLGFFGTVVGFVWYYEGIKKIGPTRASLFINFVPVTAIILAFLILKEPITLSLFIGTVFVCSGVYLTNRS